MSYRDFEQNCWIKSGVDPYIALVDDSSEEGFRMRYDSTPGGDEGVSFGALSSEESGAFSTSEIFFDLVEARISINSAAFSDMVGPGMLIAGDFGELRFRTAGGDDDYVIEHDGDELRITNYSDVRQDITILGDGKIGIDQAVPLSTLETGGSWAGPTTTVVAGLTLDDTHFTVLGDASGGAFTIDLPAAAGVEGRIYTIKRINSGGNRVTVDADGAETIDGDLTLVLKTQHESMMIQSDGTEWWII